jgi:hypothetical protein
MKFSDQNGEALDHTLQQFAGPGTAEVCEASVGSAYEGIRSTQTFRGTAP